MDLNPCSLFLQSVNDEKENLNILKKHKNKQSTESNNIWAPLGKKGI